jgi:SAM-dependent methyltransferase
MSADGDHASPDKCRLCGSRELRLKGSKRGRVLDQQFFFYECAKCSFLFVNPTLGPEIYNDAYYRGAGADPMVEYEAEYRDHTKTARTHEFRDLFRLAGEHLRRFENPERTEPIRWLDFGCGAGGLLKFLRERASICVGKVDRRLEINGSDVGSYAKRLAAIDGFKIWSADELYALPETFDIITCIEVVEHLNEPLPTFKLLARLLAHNGLLLLSTGNLKSPLAKAFGISFPYCIPEIHISYFNPELLRTLYSQLGLTPVHVRFEETLRFKFLKNIGGSLPMGVSSRMSNSKALLRFLDFLYGVSAMPSAAKLKAMDLK